MDQESCTSITLRSCRVQTVWQERLRSRDPPRGLRKDQTRKLIEKMTQLPTSSAQILNNNSVSEMFFFKLHVPDLAFGVRGVVHLDTVVT